MTTLRTAAQQALEALEGGGDSWRLIGPAIDALRAALAESANSTKPVVESEPVAWMWEHQLEDLKHYGYRPNMRAWTTEGRLGNFENLVPVYTHLPRRTGLPHCERSCEANAFQIEIRRLKAESAKAPRREWRGLTDEAVIELLHSCDWRGMHLAVLVRAIEQALKEKNQ